MIERQKAVAEVIISLPYINTIATTFFIHSRQTSLCIRLPPMQLIHHVFTSAYLAQVLNTVILLIAVDVVYLLFRKTAFANSPDGMVQTNMNHPLAHTAINA